MEQKPSYSPQAQQRQLLLVVSAPFPIPWEWFSPSPPRTPPLCPMSWHSSLPSSALLSESEPLLLSQPQTLHTTLVPVAKVGGPQPQESQTQPFTVITNNQ